MGRVGTDPGQNKPMYGNEDGFIHANQGLNVIDVHDCGYTRPPCRWIGRDVAEKLEKLLGDDVRKKSNPMPSSEQSHKERPEPPLFMRKNVSSAHLLAYRKLRHSPSS